MSSSHHLFASFADEPYAWWIVVELLAADQDADAA